MSAPLQWLYDGPPGADAKLVLAHGAGAGMHTPFMDAVASELGKQGVRVARFEFPYMRERSAGRSRRGPDRAEVLRASWTEAVHALGEARALVIGGKSMGGRIASLVADELGVRGLVCLGYPFHPPGKPGAVRTAHLADLRTPALFVQGTRDSMGSRQDVDGYTLSRSIELSWIEDGDHSLRPRRSSGLTEAQALSLAVSAIVRFMGRLGPEQE